MTKTYNPYPSVKLNYGKDNKWFNVLFEAINRVDSSYIEYELADIDNVNATGVVNTFEHVERVFAYELYRQWANILEQNGIKNIVLNGEIGKCLKDEISKIPEYSRKNVFPDLVLHQSQSGEGNQLMICEIKRTKDLDGEKIFEDLHKISCYLDREIFWKEPFKYGVFIIMGKDAHLSMIKIEENTVSCFIEGQKSIEDYKKDKKFKKKFKDIVCISYNGITIEYQTLDILFKDIISKPKTRKTRKS